MTTCNTKYYELLGLDQKCNEADIKKAYKKAAMKYHPDRNQITKKKQKKNLKKLERHIAY